MEISNIRREMTDEHETGPGLRARLDTLRARAAESEEAAAARHQLAERTLDMTEEYFPEETAARKRKAASAGFVAGLVVGAGAVALRRR